MVEISIIDLDEIHWQGDTYGSKREEKEARDMVAERASHPAWIIEGVYGWLASVALPRATALIWLDLPWEQFRAGLIERGPRRNISALTRSMS